MDLVGCDIILTEYANIRIKWVKSVLRPYPSVCNDELNHSAGTFGRGRWFVRCNSVPPYPICQVFFLKYSETSTKNINTGSTDMILNCYISCYLVKGKDPTVVIKY
jgi:hypothetical protein